MNSAKIEGRTDITFMMRVVRWKSSEIFDTLWKVYRAKALKISAFLRRNKMMLKINAHSGRPSTSVFKEKNIIIFFPNWRGLTINQYHRYLSWISLHNSDWKIKVEQTFCSVGAKTVAPRPTREHEQIFL